MHVLLMAQLSNIKDGWKKYLTGSVSEEEKRRASICRECPHAVKGNYEKLMPDFSLKEVQGLKCDACKCPLSTKIRSVNEKCPLGKW